MTGRAASDAPRRRIALLIETASASGRDMLRGVAQYARRQGGWSLYHEPGSRREVAGRWARHGLDPSIEGILARVEDAETGRAIARTGIPAVDLLGGGQEAGLPLVHVSHRGIIRLALEHFRERGIQSFSFYGLSGVTWSVAREAAFRAEVDVRWQLGAVLMVEPRDGGALTWAAQERQLEPWLRSLPKPVGVLACYDPCALQVLEACRRAGLAVPEDVAVVGVDDDEPLCELAPPPLSSIDANHVEVGYRAAELLDALLAGRVSNPPPYYVDPAKVVIRGSSDVRPEDDPELARALRFIREQAGRGLNVESVVRHVAVSRSVLQRRFRARLGRTVNDEITRVRLARARELLAMTDLPIKAIALELGFEPPERLGRWFRARAGISPSAYRTLARARRSSKGRA